MGQNRQKFKLLEKVVTWFMLLILVTQVLTSGLFGVLAHAESSINDLLLVNEQGDSIHNLTLEQGETKIIGVKTTNKEDSSVQVNLSGLRLIQDQTNERNVGNQVSIAYSEEASNVIISWQSAPVMTQVQANAEDDQGTTENNQVTPVVEDPAEQFVTHLAWLVVEGTEAGTYQVQASSSRESGLKMSELLVVTVNEKEEKANSETAETLNEDPKEPVVKTRTDESEKNVNQSIKSEPDITAQVWDLDKGDWGKEEVWGKNQEITNYKQYDYGIKYTIKLDIDAEEAKKAIDLYIDLMNENSGVNWSEVDNNSVSVTDPSNNDVEWYGEDGWIDFDPTTEGTYQISFIVKFKSLVDAFHSFDDGEFNYFPLKVALGEYEESFELTKTKAVYPQPIYVTFLDNIMHEIIKKKITFELKKTDGSVAVYSTEGDTERSFGAWINATSDMLELTLTSVEDNLYQKKNHKFNGTTNMYIEGFVPSTEKVPLEKSTPEIKTSIQFNKEKNHYYDSVTSTQEIMMDLDKTGSRPRRFLFSSTNTGKNMIPQGDVRFYRMSKGEKKDGISISVDKVWKSSGLDGKGNILEYEYLLPDSLLEDEKIFMETDWQLMESTPGMGIPAESYQLTVYATAFDENDGKSGQYQTSAQTNAYAKAVIKATPKKEVLKDSVPINFKDIFVGDTITYRMTIEAEGEETAQMRIAETFEDQLPKGLSWEQDDLEIILTTYNEVVKLASKQYSIDGGNLKINFKRPPGKNVLFISKAKPEARKLVIEVKMKVTEEASGILENKAIFNTQRRTNDFISNSWAQDPPSITNLVFNTVRPNVNLEKHVYANDPVKNKDQVDAEVLYTDNQFYYSIDASLTPESGAMYNGKITDKMPDNLVIQNKPTLLINGIETFLPDDALKIDGQNISVDFAKIQQLNPMTNKQKVQLIIPVVADKSLANAEKPSINNAKITGTDKQGNSPVEKKANREVSFVYPPGKLSVEKSIEKIVNSDGTATSDKRSVKVGDIVTYKIIVRNTKEGSIVKDVHAKDTVPKGLEILPNTIKVQINEAEVKPGENLGKERELDVLVGDLKGLESATVTFDVTVTEMASGELVNVATAVGKIDKVPNGPLEDEKPGKDSSTEVEIKPNPELTKKVSQDKAYKGQKLTYTIVASNEKGAPIINGKINDKLPEEVKKSDTITWIDGKPIDDNQVIWSTDKTSFDYSIPNLKAGQTILIVFEVEVVTDKFDVQVLNKATLNGEYVTDAERETTASITKVPAEAEFKTVRQSGKLALKKEVTKALAEGQGVENKDGKVVKVEDVIEYKLKVENLVSGPSISYNVKVTDTIPKGLEYIPGSLKIGGKAPTNGSKIEGNQLEVILGEVTETTELPEITFEVQVTKEALGETKNQASIHWEYESDPTDPNSGKTPKEEPSNEVVVYKQPDPKIEKAITNPANKKVFPGEIVTYEITVMNGSKSNKDYIGELFNAHVKDELDPNLAYVAGTTIINGKRIENDDDVWTDNKTFSYTFDHAIPAGESREITFNVKVGEKAQGAIENNAVTFGEDKDKNEIDGGNSSAIVTVYPNPGKLEIAKSVFDKDNTKEIEESVVAEDSIVTYRLVVKNTVAAPSEVLNATIEDELPTGLLYVKDSLVVIEKPATVNVKELGVSGKPEKVKVVLDKLSGEEEVTIEFKAKVTKAAEVIISNKGIAHGQVTTSPGDNTLEKLPPEDNTVVIYKAPDPKITKKVTEPSNKEVIKGSKVTYELVVTNGDKNTGELLNGIVKDSMPKGLVYVSGTLEINERPATAEEEATWIADPEILEYKLPSPYKGGETTIIRFTAEVTGVDKAEEIGQPITNIATVTGKDKDNTPYKPEGDKDEVIPVRKDGKLALKKSVYKGTEDFHNKVVSVDDIIDYQLVVENIETLPSEVHQVIVTDAIPKGLEYQADSVTITGAGPTAKAEVKGNVLTAELDTLTEGQQVTITFKVKVTKEAAGTIENIAEAKGQVTTVDGKESSVSKESKETVNKAPNPKITKKVTEPSSKEVIKGSHVTYELVVTNGDKNTGELLNGIVKDSMPKGLVYVSGTLEINERPATAEEEATWIADPEILEYKLPSPYKGGETTIIRFTAEVTGVDKAEEIGQPIINIATVTGKDKDNTLYKPEGDKDEVIPVRKDGKLALKKSVYKGTEDFHNKVVSVDDIIDYQLVVENTETLPSEVHQVIVTDTIPKGLEYQADSVTITGAGPTAKAEVKGNVLTAELDTLTEGQQVTITFKVKVTKEAAGTIENIAEAKGQVTTVDGKESSVSKESKETVNKAPNPKITKKVTEPSSKEVIKGSHVTYELVVTNGDKNTGELLDGVVTDQLPEGLVYLAGTLKINGVPASVEEESSWSSDNKTLEYNLPSPYKGGETTIISFTVEVTGVDKAEEIGQPITNIATVTGKDKDNRPYKPEGDKDEVIPVRKDGKLALKKSVYKGTEDFHDKVVSVDDIIDYQLVVENTETLPSEVHQVIVTDTIPKGLEYQVDSVTITGAGPTAKAEVKGNLLTAELDTLTEGQQVTITFKVKVTENAAGTIKNIAQVTGQITPVGGNSTIDLTSEDNETVKREPKPTIKKAIVDPANGKVTKGEQIKYRLVVTNGDKNTGILKNGMVTDQLVPELKHVAGTTTMDGQPVDESNWENEKLTLKLPETIEGGSLPIIIEFIVRVETNFLGEITNIAQVSGQNINDTGNYEDNHQVGIEVIPRDGKLSLKKTVTKNNENVQDKVIHVGDIVTYTLVVENIVTDPSEVREIILEDVIPDGLVYQANTLTVNGKSKPDSHIVGQKLTINLGHLTEKKQIEVAFDVEVTADAKGKITNIATVTGTVTPPGKEEETLPEITDTVENSKVPEPKIKKSIVNDQGQPIEPATAIKGQEVTYKLLITNGTATHTGILNDGVVTDELDAKLSYVAGTTQVNGTSVSDEIAGWSGNKLTYKLPKVFVGGEELTITFKVKVNSSDLGLIANTGYISGKDDDGAERGDSSVTNVEVVRGTADPVIYKEVWSENGINDMNNTIVNINTVLQYKLIVENRNQEPSEIRDTVVTDTIPAGLDYVPGSLTLGEIPIGDEHVVNQKLTLNVGTLTEGQKKIISFQVVVTEKAKGVSQNIAYVSGKTPDPTGVDKEIKEIPSNPVDIYKPADPAIKKSVVGTKEVTIGSEVVYRLEVSNGTEYNSQLFEGSVSDALQEGLLYKPGTTRVDGKLVNDEGIWEGNNLTINLASPFEGGAVTIIEFTVTVNKLGSIQNTAYLQGQDFNKAFYVETGEEVISVEPKPDPTIEKNVRKLDNQEFSAKNSTIEVTKNDHLIYQLIVRNGTSETGTLFDAKVEDKLPKGLMYVPNTTTINGTTTLSDSDHWRENTFTYMQSSMAGGEVWDIQFEVAVTETADAQQIKNYATIDGKDLNTLIYNHQSDVSVVTKVISKGKEPTIDDPIKLVEEPPTGKLPNTSNRPKDKRILPRTGENNDEITGIGYIMILNFAIFYVLKRKSKKNQLNYQSK